MGTSCSCLLLSAAWWAWRVSGQGARKEETSYCTLLHGYKHHLKLRIPRFTNPALSSPELQTHTLVGQACLSSPPGFLIGTQTEHSQTNPPLSWPCVPPAPLTWAPHPQSLVSSAAFTIGSGWNLKSSSLLFSLPLYIQSLARLWGPTLWIPYFIDSKTHVFPDMITSMISECISQWMACYSLINGIFLL